MTKPKGPPLFGSRRLTTGIAVIASVIFMTAIQAVDDLDLKEKILIFGYPAAFAVTLTVSYAIRLAVFNAQNSD